MGYTARTRAGRVNEYEREPVPARARLGFRSFIGQYAGEHTAGTGLMIGPLFVAAGVSALQRQNVVQAFRSLEYR